MPRFYSRFFGVQRQAGRAAGTLQLAATNFVIGSVIADGFQRAALVGNAEPRQAVIFQRFTAHRVTIQHQLHTGGAGVDLHAGLAPLAAGALQLGMAFVIFHALGLWRSPVWLTGQTAI